MKTYNKLVRDNIPDIIKNENRFCTYRTVRNDKKQYESFLKKKLLEETEEFLENPCLEELVDIYEVIVSLLDCHNVAVKEMFDLAIKKRKVRGGFFKGIVLETVSDS